MSMSKSSLLKQSLNFRRRDRRFWAVSILLTITLGVLVISSPRVPVHAEVVINTIPVGGHLLEPLAYDSGKGEIFVSDLVNGISVISDSSNAVIATVTGASGGVDGMTYDPGKNEIFAASDATNNVSVISDDTNTVIANVTVGDEPVGIAYDSGKGEVFVANIISDSVSVISDHTNSVVATVNVGSWPSGVTYDPVKGQIFVTNDRSDTVSVISDNTNTVVATIPVVHEPCGLAFDSGKGEVFVASSVSNLVSVISDKTNTVVASVIGATSLSLNGVAYDSKRGEVFVTNTDYDTVSVISDGTNSVVATVNVGSGPYAVAYDSGKSEIFVTNSDSGMVSVISDSATSAAKIQYIGDVTINADGTVSPSAAPIQQTGNVYTLTSDVGGSITVERSNITFEGNGLTVNGILQIGSLPTASPTVGNPVISDVTIKNLTVTGSYNGIELWQASNVIVANNTIIGTGNGIYALEGPTTGIDVEGGGSNIITGNNVSNNYNAISFFESNNNLIVGNNITNNHNPYLIVSALMFWSPSSNNTVYHNNFINNTSSAGTANEYGAPFPGNTWDDGYPSGGNYWSDYQTRYPNATEIGNSGIGNTPFVIDSQNEDRYPLMEPFTTTPPQISLLSPTTNMKYNESSVPLVFTVDGSVNWVGYSLDGLKNVTVIGNTTLTGLSSGLHSVTVYANDTFGNMGASQTVSFTIAKPFPTVTVAAVSGTVAAVVVAAGLLVYFKKTKRHA
jgi:YVTN family beta-propeller protein/parallel beta-helix repeat protein